MLWMCTAWAVPEVVGPVSDHRDVLTPSEERALSHQLVDLRERTGVQVALMTTSVVPYKRSLESYSLEIAESWGGGSGERNDGLLVLLVVDARRSRIEVGYGLEGYVTDAEAGALLSGAVPHLRNEDYAGAFRGIVDGLASEVESLKPGEPIPWWRSGLGMLLRWVPRPGWQAIWAMALGHFSAWLPMARVFGGVRPERLDGVPRPFVFAVFAVFWGLVLGLYVWFVGAAALSLVCCAVAVGVFFAGFVGAAPTRLRAGLAVLVSLVLFGAGGALALAVPNEGIQALMAVAAVGFPVIAGLALEGGWGSSSEGGGGGSGSSSHSSSSSYTSSTSSGSSSSSGTDWSGGGGGFGGGGASGSW